MHVKQAAHHIRDQLQGALTRGRKSMAEAARRLLIRVRSAYTTWAAGAALDRADSFVATYGRRYAEGLLLLLRARLLRARGESAADVRAMAERARTLSIELGAHLFAHRARELL